MPHQSFQNSMKPTSTDQGSTDERFLGMWSWIKLSIVALDLLLLIAIWKGVVAAVSYFTRHS